MNWELAAVPYWPIHRRLVWRRRLLALLTVTVIAGPIMLLQHQRAAEPVSVRVFNDVAATISLRYFDRDFHHVDWPGLVARYRPLVTGAGSEQERYTLLRRMVGSLGDSHTAVYSPTDLHRAHNGLPDFDWRVIRRGVGYLRIRAFPDSVNDVLGWAMSEVGSQSALVLDLRGNPGGLVDAVDATAGMFLPAHTLVSSGRRRWGVFGPQHFYADDSAGVHYAGRLIVLVDGGTRSGAEALARALQYYRRAVIVGTHTAGQVLGVDVQMPLPDGGLLRVATLDMRGPDGVRLEGKGVTPDLIVRGTAGDPARRLDPQLRAALALL